MTGLMDYLSMGGYAVYVWSSFGLTAVVMGWIFLDSRRQLRRRERELAALQAMAPHRRRQPGPPPVGDEAREGVGS